MPQRKFPRWTSPPRGTTSWAAWLASRPQAIDDWPQNSLASAPYIFELWARGATQLPPEGDWTTWLILGGRGSGKTRAGAEWVRAQVEGATPLARGARSRLALVAETADQARDVMVLGESGLMAVSPPDRRPVFHVSRRRLEWPNGAQAQLFSAGDPESLRGPQFDGAWCDELAKWRKAQAAWDMLQFGLRLGPHPRQVVTTTPRANPALIAIMEAEGTATTRAATRENAANLAPSFLRRIERRYGGTTLGRQELDGDLILDAPGALWTRAMLDGARIAAAPPLDRIIVAVDPPVTSRASSDACGIVVAGMRAEPGEPPLAVVLADASVKAKSPSAWAARAIAAFRLHRADRIVAEINQGGDLVETVLRQIAPDMPFKGVYARRGKVLRAEPVAALYEQGRVRHAGRFDALEDQMCAFGADGFSGQGRSPDRVDALVWAITELLLTAPRDPHVRGL